MYSAGAAWGVPPGTGEGKTAGRRHSPPGISGGVIAKLHQSYPADSEEEEYLAKLERYNVNYYTDWFKRRTGMSPGTYLRNVRIRKAKEYLAQSAYGLTDIAVMVGYSSNATFTRAFRTVTGMTPKDYRNCECFRSKTG